MERRPESELTNAQKLHELDIESPLQPFGPIRTRNKKFAAMLQKAGHPVILVEDETGEIQQSLYPTSKNEAEEEEVVE